MNKKTKGSKTKIKRENYLVEEKNNGKLFVYLAQVAPVLSLFDVVNTRAEAEAAIELHKAGKHSTQEKWGRDR